MDGSSGTERGGAATTELLHALHGQSDACLRAMLDVLNGAVGDPVRSQFTVRALRAVGSLTARGSREQLLEASQESQDSLVLVTALRNLALADGELGNGAAPNASLRETETMGRLANAEGGLRSAAELGELLGGMTRQGVDNRRKLGRLLAIDRGRRGYGYPAWQVWRGSVLPGLEQTLAVLRRMDPWTQLTFFVGVNPGLDGEKPLELLRRGETSLVLAAAALLADEE